jgi:hypothetical protein
MKRTKNYYRLRLLARIAFWSALAIGIYVVASQIWWVGDGYCFGNMTTCDARSK